MTASLRRTLPIAPRSVAQAQHETQQVRGGPAPRPCQPLCWAALIHGARIQAATRAGQASTEHLLHRLDVAALGREFPQFVGGQRLPPDRQRDIGSEALHQRGNLVQRKPHLLRELDQPHLIHRSTSIAALSMAARWFGEHATLLVIAYG